MSALAVLIADQAQDMRTGHRARDVFDPHSIPLLPTDDGLPRYSRGLRLVSIAHGTLYAYKRLGCRCTECRAVNAKWQREYRRQLREAA